MLKIADIDKNYEFDYIAENIFYPIYPVISDDIIKETSVVKGKFLDIGCGGGHLGLNLLKKTNMNGVFIDINKYAIEKTKNRAKEWYLESRVEALEENICNLSFPDDSFDLIISRGSMGFWKDTEAAFKEIYRVLKPGGLTYIGAGLGNNKLVKEVYKKMSELDSDWPNSIHKKRGKKKITTDEYLNLFKRLRFYKYRVITNEEKGRWFIIEKEKGDNNENK